MKTKFNAISVLAMEMVIVSFLSGSATATNSVELLRVYAIKPACFEYMFTSAMERPEGRQSLSFNHINGRTVFAGVGDTVGEYKVMSFDPSVERVFNASVNAYMEKKDGTVVLQSSDGRKLALDMGKVLSQPGWMACLVWLDSGSWMYVGENDAVLAGDTEVPVIGISEDAITVMADNSKRVVPFISDNEKISLLALWEGRRKAREEAAKLAEKKQLQEESEPKQVITQVIRHAPALPVSAGLSRRSIDVRMPPQFFYGTEYRYPVSFESVPVYIKTSSGVRMQNRLVLPRTFQTGWTGYGINQSSDGIKVTIPR
jgi:hypothetical protein